MTDDYSALDEIQQLTHERPIPCELITGVAGTGKSYSAVQAIQADPEWGMLTASTGIAAVNVGAITTHSTVRYSDTASLRDSYLSGRLARVLHGIARQHRRLVIDEASMYSGAQLDLLYRGCQAASRYADVEEAMGITLIADFAQLAPVREPWCFEANCWDEFRSNTRRLTKVWRQDSGSFLDALNLVRRGEGSAAAEVLSRAGARWTTQLDTEFDGTTILPKNDMVSRYNQMALDRVGGESFLVRARRWGQLRSEWGENQRTHEWGIPPALRLKLGCYVMILANHPEFAWVNGDCGHVEQYTEAEGIVSVRLMRTGEVVDIPMIVRDNFPPDRPDGWVGRTIHKNDDVGEYIPEPHYRGRAKRYVVGQVEYFPMRLAYATTVHKSQSLTLDRVQVDFRDWFFGKPAMLYVALSRCRTLEGLRLVGIREKFVKQCAFDPKVKEYL